MRRVELWWVTIRATCEKRSWNKHLGFGRVLGVAALHFIDLQIATTDNLLKYITRPVVLLII